jgi:DNA polymerase I-like protein with 3'-5' exonuclease and polymerase domains
MKRLIFLDIETDTKQSVIWCCVTKCDGEVLVWTEAEKLRGYLKKDDVYVMHNGISFDAYHLNRLWNTKIRLSQCVDTLIMSRLLNPNRENGHSLASFGNQLGLSKIDFKDYDAGLSDEMIKYCIRDVELLEKVYDKLLKEKKQYGFSDRCFEIEYRVAALITKQERRGFKLDVPKCMVLLAGFSDRMARIEQELQQVFPPITTERYSEKTGKRLKDDVEVFNPGSRQQIAKRLMSLGWKPTKKTEKGSVIVDEGTLDGVNIPEAKLIAEYLMLQKRYAQVKSWTDAVEEDGRVRGKVITNGAVTGRMTHHSPNMAQIPSSSSPFGRECRDCWTVDEGYKLVGADASGLELRMLAHYMKDKDYVKEVIEGDIHTKNQIAAGLQTRPQAKTFIYAFLYGAGAAKIGSIVGGGAREGETLIKSFLDNTPALKTLRAKVEGMAEKGYLPGLDGRKLFVRSPHSALNTLLQSAGAIVMKKAMIILGDYIQNYRIDAHFVVNVHDEWQLEVLEKDADRVGQLAVEALEETTKELDLFCPLTGEYKVGSTWADTH